MLRRTVINCMEYRLEYVINCMDNRTIHALFEHHMPTPQLLQYMEDKNALTGKQQPNGRLNMARYVEKGSYGRFMKEHVEAFANPLSEDDMMRNWIMCKISTENALRVMPKHSRRPAK